MSYFSAILLDRLLVKNKKTIEVEVEEDREDNMDTNEMAMAIAKMIEGQESPNNYKDRETPEIGERIGIMLSQKMMGFDPMTKAKKLIEEVNRHHPIDDSHVVRKLEIKRMEDGSNTLFVEWMKHTY